MNYRKYYRRFQTTYVDIKGKMFERMHCTMYSSRDTVSNNVLESVPENEVENVSDRVLSNAFENV